MTNQANESTADTSMAHEVNETKTIRFIRLPEVMHITALSRSHIIRAAGSDGFPSSIKIGESAVAWVESEVFQWCDDRIASSRTCR